MEPDFSLAALGFFLYWPYHHIITHSEYTYTLALLYIRHVFFSDRNFL
jgi:hypothetical protein